MWPGTLGCVAQHCTVDCPSLSPPLPLPLCAAQVRAIFSRGWLSCSTAYYLKHIPCVGGDWLLVVARIMPFLVIAFMDTALFFQVGREREQSGTPPLPV